MPGTKFLTFKQAYSEKLGCKHPYIGGENERIGKGTVFHKYFLRQVVQEMEFLNKGITNAAVTGATCLVKDHRKIRRISK